MLFNLDSEVARTMALIGCTNVNELNAKHIASLRQLSGRHGSGRVIFETDRVV